MISKNTFIMKLYPERALRLYSKQFILKAAFPCETKKSQ